MIFVTHIHSGCKKTFGSEMFPWDTYSTSDRILIDVLNDRSSLKVITTFHIFDLSHDTKKLW